MNNGAYRTPPMNEAKQHLLSAIAENRENKARVLEKIAMKSSVSAPYSSDLAMVEQLREVYATACEHERELLRQLAEVS